MRGSGRRGRVEGEDLDRGARGSLGYWGLGWALGAAYSYEKGLVYRGWLGLWGYEALGQAWGSGAGGTGVVSAGGGQYSGW